jgi:hypothetical protein
MSGKRLTRAEIYRMRNDLVRHERTLREAAADPRMPSLCRYESIVLVDECHELRADLEEALRLIPEV